MSQSPTTRWPPARSAPTRSTSSGARPADLPARNTGHVARRAAVAPRPDFDATWSAAMFGSWRQARVTREPRMRAETERTTVARRLDLAR